MCVDLELSERNSQKRDRRWRFNRLRASARKLDEGVLSIRPTTRRRAGHLDTRPVMLTGPEAAAYSTSDALAASAATSRRIEDAKDARQFAENYPYAGFSAA